VVYEGYKELKYKPCKSLCETVDKGALGRGSGDGVDKY
jgi:3-hydroxyacyl-CoA dehydrogenase